MEMSEKLARVVTTLSIDSISSRGVQIADLFLLWECQQAGEDVESAIADTQGGKLLRTYQAFISDKHKISEITHGVEVRRAFVENPDESTLEALAEARKLPVMKEVLQAEPDFFTKVVTRKPLNQDVGGWHPNSQISIIFRKINLALTQAIVQEVKSKKSFLSRFSR